MGRGQHFVSTREAAELLGVNPATVWTSLDRARQARKMVSVTKGGWVPVPPEYRKAGAPPPIHYIDQLMDHLGTRLLRRFPVGRRLLRSLPPSTDGSPSGVGCALAGAAQVGRSRIQFVQRQDAADRRTQQANVPTGRVTVSTPETTVLDLVETPSLGAGLSNVATVIGDLLVEDQLDPAALADAARTYPTTSVQRAGYLIESMAIEVGVDIELSEFARLVAPSNYTQLSPSSPPTSSRAKRWRVQINTTIEHDL